MAIREALILLRRKGRLSRASAVPESIALPVQLPQEQLHTLLVRRRARGTCQSRRRSRSRTIAIPYIPNERLEEDILARDAIKDSTKHSESV